MRIAWFIPENWESYIFRLNVNNSAIPNNNNIQSWKLNKSHYFVQGLEEEYVVGLGSLELSLELFFQAEAGK